MTEKRSPSRVFAAISAALLFSLLFSLALITTRSADDFWYSTFLDGGVSAWLRNLGEHYEIFNGRTLVHALATLVLHFGNAAFALSVLICTAVICVSAGKNRLFSAVLIPGLLLIMPRPMAVEGMLWSSAFFNYFFPSALALALISVSLSAEKRAGCALAVILALASGATTEQTGLSVCALFALLALAAIFRRGRAALSVGVLIAAAAGAATIFLSPATMNRAGIETSAPLIGRVSDALAVQLDLLQASLGMAALMLTVPALISLKIRKARVLIPSCAACLCLIFALVFRIPALLGAYIALALCLGAILIFSGEQKTGAVLFFGACTLAVMLVTQSNAARTLVPAYIALAALAAELLGSFPKRARLAVMTALLLLVGVKAWRNAPGYIHNAEIEAMNARSAESSHKTGEMLYCMDYDPGYTHTKPYNDGYFCEKYRDSAHLDASTRLYFYSESLPVVYASGERCSSPAIRDASGAWLLPLRDIVESAAARSSGAPARGLSSLSMAASTSCATLTAAITSPAAAPRASIPPLPRSRTTVPAFRRRRSPRWASRSGRTNQAR
ncbi:MAG: hypothetical protein IJP43_09655 [Oscillospiraceae bacterium]|nr:hypothetical protein [Oscillospiraceae bacterium]